MAIRLADGSIQLKDGRILFANSLILAQDFAELVPLFTPPPAWPFVSGGGGGGGGNGVVGRNGVQGNQGPLNVFGGPQGNQGAGSQGPQGNQGSQGNQGRQGSQGNQGNQGFQGTNPGPQGNQGAQGFGGGPQGNQGNQGNQGFQGTNPGPQGPQGSQGSQGSQGNQGFQGDNGGGLSDAIISAARTGANIDFLSVGAGLSFTLKATTTPFVYDINGTRYTIAADVVAAATDNANNFIWVDNTGAVGVTTLPCMYSYTPPAGVTGQHWFDLSADRMKVWNGSAFVPTDRIFVGYVRADGGTLDARYACEPNLVTPSDRFNRFGDGSLGFLEVSAGTTTLTVGMRSYSAIVVRGTGVLTYTDTSGQEAILELLAQGVIAVLGTGSITASGRGLPGGAGFIPSPSTPATAGEGGGLGGAGGGGGGGNSGAAADGGGHASSQRFPTDIVVTAFFPTLGKIVYWGAGLGGASSVAGTAGTGNGVSTGFFSPIFLGAGNGGGGGGRGGFAASVGGAGGDGGGTIMILAASVAIGTGASILTNGVNGTAGAFSGAGGGGGGGGGTILIYSRVFQNDGSFTATAGTGGAGAVGGFAGGAGAAGAAIHIYN